MVNFLFMDCLSLHLLVNSLHKMDISPRRTLSAGPGHLILRDGAISHN